ncbi:MAG: hypothetical protein WD334_02390, partial [Chitinophagales bacterium]
IAFLLIVAFNAYLLFLNVNLRSEQAQSAKKIGQIEQKIDSLSEQDQEEIELAVHMQRLLTYADKLWFSGKAGNKELTDFYVHEIEESMERIHDVNMIYDGVEISPLMKQFGLKAVETFEENLKNKESFESAYRLLITECNNCHNSSKHAYIQIKTPETPSFDNQEYQLNN